ncbi:MAG: MAPEG family protein [Hyphomicrobiales bacterium]
MSLHATALYAGILALLLMYLSFGVIKLRKSAKISIGDGGDEALRRAMRVQANCAEYVPISLILIGLIEANGLPFWLVHALGIVLVAGRVMHAVGLGKGDDDFTYRIRGMQLTFAVIAAGAGINIVSFAWGLV